MTTVNVATKDVTLIAALGIGYIDQTRADALDQAVNALMVRTKLSMKGRVKMFPTRADAIEYLKRPGSTFAYGISEYMYLTRYDGLRDDRRRLQVLTQMAQSSIDGTIRLDSSDHSLLRAYAPALHKFVQETTGLSHTGAA